MLLTFRYWNIFPPFGKVASGVLSLSLIMIPVGLAEILTYAPIIGGGATYLGFLTGNLSNLKVPAAVMALEITETDPASDEAEIISILSVATTAIVSALIIFVGVLLMVPLSPILSRPALKPAFDNVLPALFGALAAYWIMRNWKLSVTPIVLVVLIFAFTDVPTSAMIPISALISVLAARVMYKKGWLETKKRPI